LSFFSDDIAPGLYYKYMNSLDVVSLAKVNTARKKMLKSIIRSAALAIVAVIGFSSAPAFAEGEGNTCESSCSRTRPCQYSAKELSLNTPAIPTPTPETPAPLVDPPAVQTPAPAPAPVQTPPRRRPSARG
jgi:hypothetical protein